MTDVVTHIFRHNDTEHLEELLNTANANTPKTNCFLNLFIPWKITFSITKNNRHCQKIQCSNLPG